MAEWIMKEETDMDGVGCYIRKGELIRCKDCKHWECDDDESYCDELGIFNTDMNSYCSYAKRKEE